MAANFFKTYILDIFCILVSFLDHFLEILIIIHTTVLHNALDSLYWENMPVEYLFESHFQLNSVVVVQDMKVGDIFRERLL